MDDKTKLSISIIVPAYKEAQNLELAVNNILKSADGLFSDYEILIIDCLDKDGKDDGTRKIADELAGNNPKILAIHNPYVSLGAKYWQGVSLAKYGYISWIPGDNETDAETIKTIFNNTGKADIVCSYTINPEVRSLKRRIISKVYTFFINALFGLNLKYFNGVSVYKASLLKPLLRSAGKNTTFSYNAEILVRLLKAGHHYIEVPQRIRKQQGRGGFLRYGPYDTIKMVLKLFWEVEIRGKI
jgi:glycosyltransferase involved in cell wall biosynthesis